MSTHAIPPLVAITAEPSNLVSATDLARVAAALQTQVTNHLAPSWHTPATVAAFPSPRAVPRGWWPIIVKADLNEPGAAGYHTDKLGQPIAYVQAAEDWSVTASHELLEMLCDPWGRRFVTCADPRGAEYGHARVLVEVCDPCEAHMYPVLGVAVSDFVEPSYYGSHRWGFGKAGPALSYLGHIRKALSIDAGGYLSWVAADNQWHQLTWFGGAAPKLVNISASMDSALDSGLSPREAIDLITHPSK